MSTLFEGNYVEPTTIPPMSAYGGYPPYYNYGVINQNNWHAPEMQGTLTPEQIASLKGSQANLLDITIEPTDATRAICNHVHNNQSHTHTITDGEHAGKVYCDICGMVFDPSMYPTEQIEEWIDKLTDAMEVAKMCGCLPNNIIAEYFQIIPLLKKFPHLYKYAANNMNKSVANMDTAAGNSSYFNAYNTLFNSWGNGNGFGQMPSTPWQSTFGQGAYNPMMGGAFNGAYNNQQVVNPNVNPMQSVPGQWGAPVAPQGQQFVGAPNNPYATQQVPPVAPATAPAQAQTQTSFAPVTAPAATEQTTSEATVVL